MGSFKDVVGHKNIIEYIQNAVNANIHHVGYMQYAKKPF